MKMKACTAKIPLKQAQNIIYGLKARFVYACLAGSEMSGGYEVLVNNGNLEKAQLYLMGMIA